MKFQKAVKHNRPVRLELQGVYNAGKTFTALSLARTFSAGGKTLVVDTETQRSSLYADMFDFDVVYLSDYKPGDLEKLVATAVEEGYKTLIVDSFSDYWVGTGGVLSIANGKFAGWKPATEAQNHLLLSLLSAPIHLVATLRMKIGYNATQDPATGRQVVTRLGLEPIQRDDCPYRFDWVMELNEKHEATMLKSPIPDLENANLGKPGEEIANNMLAFLRGDGVPEVQAAPAQTHKEEILL